MEDAWQRDARIILLLVIDGLTVTVIGNADPAHEPVVEVGVTLYTTVPAIALLGLVNV